MIDAMRMHYANFHKTLVGAIFLITPIFYSASLSAQSSSQANVVLELQQLRQEIAELRGLIERQQYQIRQLERGRDLSSPAAASPDLASTDATAAPTLQAPNQSPVGNPTPTQSQAIDTPALANTAPPSTVTGQGQSLPQTEEQFYRPYSGDAAIVDENPEVVSAARQARQASDTYPPVVDRSIPEQTSSVPVLQAPTQATSSQPVSPSAAGPVGQTTSPPVFDQNGQVIDPSQTTASAIKQGPNSVPADSAPINAGVIPVPPQNNQPVALPQPSQVVSNAPAPQPVVLAEDVMYQQGFDLLKQFKYDEAVGVFKQQVERYPSGSYADDGLYWIAESMYLNRNLPESKKYFREILDNFAQSPRVPDAMLKTAYIEQDQGNEIEARILLQEIIQYHPRSDAAISAKNRLEKLQ